MHTSFNLPPDCTVNRQDECSVLLIFNYAAQTVTIDFSFAFRKQRLRADYQTDNTINTVIGLEEPIIIEHVVEYYCSTGDDCDLNYVKDKALPLYTEKSCQNFRAELIRYLNPDPSSAQRDCFQNDNTTSLCILPCELQYQNPNSISRSCTGIVDIGFETTVGQSTPINKPEYNSRSITYGCSSEMCNGIPMQQRIQRLISLDNGECIITLNDTIDTTTSVPLTTTTTATIKPGNQAITFSKSFILIIFILCFVYFFP